VRISIIFSVKKAMGNKIKTMDKLSEALKKQEDAYHYRKVLHLTKKLVETNVKLPKPGPPGPTSADRKDPYDGYNELKKTITRESFVMNGRKYDECVGDTDKKSAFNMWYRECKAELKSKMSHLPLVDILSPVLKKKRLSRRISVIPESDTDQHENYSIHILIMWIMQASSRSRSGNLAYRAVQETLGVEDGNTKTMIFDTMNHSLTTIDISTKALMVKITSVLTVQRCEDEIDFEFDVCCSTTQTLDLESFIFDRSIEFDYLKCAAAGEDKAKFAKLRKKQPLNTIVRMDSINFKENHSELEVLAKVYHPDDFEDCKKNAAAATKSST